MNDEDTGRLVVEVQPAGNPLPVGNIVLTLVIDVVTLAARIGQLANEARHCRRTQERHVFGAQRNGKAIGAEHQIVEKRLQPAVNEGWKADVSLLSCGRPQRLVDPDIEQETAGLRLAPELPNIPEVRAVLKSIPEHHFESLVDLFVGRKLKKFVARRVQVRERFRHVQLGSRVDQAHASAAVQLALRIDLVGRRRNLEGVFAGGIRDRIERRLQPDRRLRDGAGLQVFEHVEMNRNTAESLQYQLDVAGGRHDRRVVDAVLRQPRKGCLGEARFE